MDYMGILKEAWDVTRRNKRLWILGLFAGGSASALVEQLELGFVELQELQGPAAGVGEHPHAQRGSAARARRGRQGSSASRWGPPLQWWVFIGVRGPRRSS